MTQIQVSTQNTSPAVRGWLWLVAAMIFMMVVVGGATRLTESGLSITEWKPITGIIPPLTAADWAEAFEKYKQIPQYAKMFPDMTLGAFQSIFLWEWSHRLLGRLIGIVFAVPLLWFWVRGQISKSLKWPLAGLLALGGLQGFVGWWMVKSGLVDRVEVSQYRLAIHLLLATLTFTLIVRIATKLKPRRGEASLPAQARLRFTSTLILVLSFVQIGLGALVAGLRAGLVYNTWPLMDGRFVPPTEDLTRETPLWRNFFENITTVQFDHRLGAYVLLALSVLHAFDAVKNRPKSHTSRRAVSNAFLIATQALIGIMTLVLVVPVWAGILHQAFAMIVISMLVVHQARVFCMILGLTSLPKLAAASEFSEIGTSAYLTGQITDGDDAKFMEFLHRQRPAPLKVRAAHIATAVDALGARCDSACTLIFAGGVQRHYIHGGEIFEGFSSMTGLGFHSAHLKGDETHSSAKSDAGNTKMRQLYVSMGQPAAATFAENAPFNTLFRPCGATALATHIATSLNSPVQ
eukprot:gene6267-6339_t